MQRRKFIASIGSVAAGAAAVTGTGAFTSAEADRAVDVNIAEDSSAYLGLSKSGKDNQEYFDTSGDEFAINFGSTNAGASGMNPNADIIAKSVFTIKNQGTQEVTVSLSGSGDISTQSQGTEVSAPDSDGINVSLDDDDDDATLGTGESIDVDFAINSGTSNLSGTLTIKGDAN